MLTKSERTELRQLAVGMMEQKQEDSGFIYVDQKDLTTLAQSILEEFQADDDELVTTEWLLSVGGQPDEPREFFAVTFPSVRIGPFLWSGRFATRSPSGIDVVHGLRYVKIDVGSETMTRRELRHLSAALRAAMPPAFWAAKETS